MSKSKKLVFSCTIAILGIIVSVFLIAAMPRIEMRTWTLSYAQQVEAPYFVVAHNEDYDFSDNESGLFDFSKEVELTLEANDGKLIIVDKTNEKTYEGTYTVNSGERGRFRTFKNKTYTVVIDGLEGTANFSTNRTLFISIDRYCLYFQ